MKINRLIYVATCSIAFVACVGTEKENKTILPDVVLKDDFIEKHAETAEEIEIIDKTNDWRIDDYVSLLVDANIVMDAQEVGINDWYYDTLDLTGGYASIRGPVEGWQEFALWKMDNGDDLIGKMSVGCGPACDYQFEFYKGLGETVAICEQSTLFPFSELEDHQNNMVTKIIQEYPVDYPEDSQLVYNLPQKGTGMQVDVVVGADEVRVPIAQLKWDGMAFTLTEKFDDITLVEG